jgi:membrane-associated phospholipid phosphatase
VRSALKSSTRFLLTAFILSLAILGPRGFVVAQDSSEIAPSGKIAHTSFLGLLAGDFSTMVQDRSFLALYGAMVAAPQFLDEDPSVLGTWSNTRSADRIFELGDGMGGAWSPIVLVSSAYLIGRVTGKSRLTAFASDLVRAQILNGLTTGSIKYITDRRRPDGTPYSFPSGHTSTAFATASIVRRHFGKYWGGAATLAATYVGVSRLQENKHYVSDVIAGAIVGTYVASLVAPAGRSHGIELAPAMVSGGPGLSLTKRL